MLSGICGTLTRRNLNLVVGVSSHSYRHTVVIGGPLYRIFGGHGNLFRIINLFSFYR